MRLDAAVTLRVFLTSYSELSTLSEMISTEVLCAY